VVLTPPILAQETYRLLKEHALSGHGPAPHLFALGLVGMVFSFIAGRLALKWLSRWLEGGRWKFFGFHCLIAAAGVLTIHSCFLAKYIKRKWWIICKWVDLRGMRAGALRIAHRVVPDYLLSDAPCKSL
jgi:hypothetical protein